VAESLSGQAAGARPFRLLFVKEALAWPRTSGHDVHCFHMMRALQDLGHGVSLATLRRPDPEAVRGLALEHVDVLDGEAAAGENGAETLPLSKLQERFRSYWGISPQRVRRVGHLARQQKTDAVVVVGLSVLPYLGAVDGSLRVWYAADEWAWHHLSQVRLIRPRTWGNVRQAFVKGLYERAYRSRLDRVWVVSEADRRAMRWVAGVRDLDVLPNGVDADHYAPAGSRDEVGRSCVFWGRLDFGPNIQALEWFCGRVWPVLRRQVPDARFTIYGFQPTDPVRALAGRDGVDLIPDLPDLRPEVGRHQIVVLPFVSGGGIKNKLLEAAGMGKAIVCTPRACGGLRADGPPPLVTARSVGDWVGAVTQLWSDEGGRRRLGEQARRWVVEHHTWKAAAQTALRGLEASLGGRAVP
jgi:glycosyltransferase involved in cell wall biosynthesis